MGISVDPPSSNAAMVEKLDLPFPLLSDPRGDLIRSLGLWNEDEGVAEPTIMVLDGSGTVRGFYSGGRDFSDRPPREVLFGLLDGIGTDGTPPGGEPEVRVHADEAERETVRPERPPISLKALVPYYKGSFFAAVALQKRLADDEPAREKVADYKDLIVEYDEAIGETAKKAS